MSAPRIVLAGVDSLIVGFEGTILTDLRAQFDALKGQGRTRPQVTLGGVPWTYVGAGGLNHATLRNERWGTLQVTCAGFCNTVPALRFDLPSETLWQDGWREAWASVRKIAKAAFMGGRLRAEKLSRLDLCVDVVGAAFGRSDTEHWVGRAQLLEEIMSTIKRRGAVDTLYWGTRKDPDREAKRTAEIQAGRQSPRHVCTCGPTCTACGAEDQGAVDTRYHGRRKKGGKTTILARTYLKSALLATRERAKAPAYKRRWTENGWDGYEPVWRFEYEMHRAWFKGRRWQTVDGEIKTLDSVACLSAAIPAVWRYLTCDWLRWCSPRGERRNRWPVRPEWALVQAAQFPGCTEGEGRLVRFEQRSLRLDQIDAQLFGLLRRRAQLSGRLDLGEVFDDLEGHAKAGDFPDRVRDGLAEVNADLAAAQLARDSGPEWEKLQTYLAAKKKAETRPSPEASASRLLESFLCATDAAEDAESLRRPHPLSAATEALIERAAIQNE